ncbi:HutD/Ves family protein [Rhodovibrionaceae bacterium A322]
MQLIKFENYQRMAWRNGGGQTAEIASDRVPPLSTDDPAAFDWRVSLAEVGRDGPYSDFSGYTRILTLVSGGGTLLTDPQGQRLRIDQLYSPQTFSGDLAYDGQLLAGPIRNFNLIYRPDRLQARVARLDLTDSLLLPEKRPSESQLLFAAQTDKAITLDGPDQKLCLRQGDSLFCPAADPADFPAGRAKSEGSATPDQQTVRLHSSSPAILLLVTLQPLP